MTQLEQNRKLADLTVGEFRELSNEGLKKVVKWVVLIYVGIPVAILAGVSIFGLVMYSIAGTTS